MKKQCLYLIMDPENVSFYPFLELWKSHHGEVGVHELHKLSIHIENSVSR